MFTRGGYQFLKEKMWDEKNGGFYWEVDVAGYFFSSGPTLRL